MLAWIRAAIFGLALLLPVAAPAQGFWSRPVTVAAAYYPAPVSYVTAYQPFYVVASVPAPVCYVVAPPALYAVPLAAPPSGEPVVPRMPGVSSTREPPRVSDSDTAARKVAIPVVTEKRLAGGCRVGFWNVSARDLVLFINGQAQTLPRNRSVTVEVEREFVWRVEGSEGQRERVPPDKGTLEIVLRR